MGSRSGDWPRPAAEAAPTRSLGTRPAAVTSAGALALFAATLVALAASGPPRWPAEAAAGSRVAGAVARWAEGCAGALDAGLVGCPRRSTEPASGPATQFPWTAPAPRVLEARVRWRDAVGAFEVRGTVTMDVQHDRVLADGRTDRFTGRFRAPFVLLVRSARDNRAFGAYAWTDAAAVDGFVIRYLGPRWQWQCCRWARRPTTR